MAQRASKSEGYKVTGEHRDTVLAGPSAALDKVRECELVGGSDGEHGRFEATKPCESRGLETVNEYSESAREAAERERGRSSCPPGDLSLIRPSEMVQITENIQILP